MLFKTDAPYARSLPDKNSVIPWFIMNYIKSMYNMWVEHHPHVHR